MLDFGIAKITDGTAHTKITRAGFAVGTPAYMSPEQASASPDITHSADLYALGCIFYQMLTSRAPFHGYTEMGVLLAHCNEDPERPSAAAPHLGIPPEVDDVVMWTLEKKPKNRPGSATSLIRRLEAIRVEFLHGGRGAAGIPAAGDAATASMVSVTPLGAEHDDDAGPTAAMSSLEPGRATTPEVPGARRVGTPAPPPSVASSPTPHALRAPVAETPDAQAGLTRDVIELARGDSKGRKGLVIAIVLLVLSGLATLVALGGKGDPAQPAAATASPAALAGAAAPETAPAAPAARKVWMRSTPTGAELVEDGQVLGLTPLEMELPKGPPRRLRLRLADYETIEVSLDSSMTSGRDVALTPKPAPKRRRPKAKARPKSRRKAAKAKAEPKPDAPKPAGDDDMFKLR